MKTVRFFYYKPVNSSHLKPGIEKLKTILNTRLIFIGVLLLFIGSLVYLIDRPPEQTYLIASLPFRFSLYNVLPPFFGSVGDFLPHFLHIVAFILLTAGVLNCGVKGYPAICLFWMIICAGFELSQKYSAQAAALVPSWFEGMFVLENTKNYFLHGTYCRLDMAAVIFGGILAYLFLIFNNRRRENYEKE